MRVVFHGANAGTFSEGFAERVGSGLGSGVGGGLGAPLGREARPVEVHVLPDDLADSDDRALYASADVIVGTRTTADLPRAEGLRLYHVPGAGTDGVDLEALPPGAVVCNCFGHEAAIAEYAMAALLARRIPLREADAELREGRWTYWAGAPERTHGELAGSTLGLLGFGHIGQAVAARAKAFEMSVVVANRGRVSSPLVDRAFGLDALPAFFAAADAYVVSLPLTPETEGLVDAKAFAAMRPHAVVVNVGRGPVIDEAALYEALSEHRIGGAVIDTWYSYPAAGTTTGLPGRLPFHTLPNIVMTPHMSGWTEGTIRRRQGVIAENVRRRMTGRDCLNVVRPARSP